MNRSEASRVICQRISRRIAEVTPEGLGRWDPAIEILRDPSDAFLDALDAFLDNDTTETRDSLRRAGDELVEAWREAGGRWMNLGCPEERKTEAFV